MGQQWPAVDLGTLSVAVHAWDLLKEVTIIFITSTIVWPQVKQQGGNTANPPPSTENWIKYLLSMALPIRTRPSFPLSQSFPSENFHKPLIIIHCRQNENHNHRKLTKLITWATALSNSRKLSNAVWGHPRWMGHGGEL